jgi:hypothetical protein
MDIFFALILGLVSGFISALATGGGLITIPGLLFMGISPISAIATSRFGAVSAGLSSSYRYQRSKAIAWKYMPYFAILAVIAGIVGPRILLSLDQHVVEKAVAILLLLMLPLLLMQKNAGVTDKSRSRTHKIIGLCLLFIILLYTTMFGAGSGILFVYVLVYLFGMKIVEANATCTVISLIGTGTGLITYIASGSVVFELVVPLVIGALVGGYIGAHTALKKGSAWVKWVLAAVIVISSAKLLFW